jgi:hypothetical protein
MKKYAVVIGFGVLMTVVCFAQQGSWKSEHYDSLLVAPNATEVNYIEWQSGLHQVTYIVEEPYPASDVLSFICEDLKQKGWTPKPGCSDRNLWMKMGPYGPGSPRAQYRWMSAWENENNEQVEYMLDYTDSKSEHYLRTLHVQAYTNSLSPQERSARSARLQAELAKAETEEKLNRQVLRYKYGVAILAYLAVLGTPLILSFTKSQFTVLYRGPYSWLTSINLLLFGTVITPLLWIGAVLISAVFGKGGLGLGLVAGVAGAVVMMMFARVGYIACAIVPLLAIGFVSAAKIPRAVRIVHCALSLATFSFFALCIHFFSGPLIHW